MSIGYQIYHQYAAYYLTFTIVDWVDLFSRKIYRDIFMDSLSFCEQQKGLLIFAYVIMTNHVHLNLQANGTIPLSDIIRDCKKFTARRFLETIENELESRKDWLLHRFKFNAATHRRISEYQIWTHENHAVAINSQLFFEQKQNYIHNNPVRAGWVSFPEDYVYSSAYELAQQGNKIRIIPWR